MILNNVVGEQCLPNNDIIFNESISNILDSEWSDVGSTIIQRIKMVFIFISHVYKREFSYSWTSRKISFRSTSIFDCKLYIVGNSNIIFRAISQIFLKRMEKLLAIFKTKNMTKLRCTLYS